MLMMLQDSDKYGAPLFGSCRRRVPLQECVPDHDMAVVPKLRLGDMLPGIAARSAFKTEGIDQADLVWRNSGSLVPAITMTMR